jgi:phosphatidylcholine synthase
VRTERWRPLTLPIALAWVGFAAWAAWGNFTEVYLANLGLVACSTYLLFAGIAQQMSAKS